MMLNFISFINEAIKKPRKRIIPEIDPFQEEDWGVEFINDEDFIGKYAIFRLNNKNYRAGYYAAPMTDHHTFVSPINFPYLLERFVEGKELIPLTNREIERIQQERIRLVIYGNSMKDGYGQLKRYKFTDLRQKGYWFIDQQFIDNYISIH